MFLTWHWDLPFGSTKRGSEVQPFDASERESTMDSGESFLNLISCHLIQWNWPIQICSMEGKDLHCMQLDRNSLDELWFHGRDHPQCTKRPWTGLEMDRESRQCKDSRLVWSGKDFGIARRKTELIAGNSILYELMEVCLMHAVMKCRRVCVRVLANEHDTGTMWYFKRLLRCLSLDTPPSYRIASIPHEKTYSILG